MPEPFSWSRQYAARQAVAERFGKIYDVPIAKRVREVLLKHAGSTGDVLEVGAGARDMGQWLVGQRAGLRYQSLDPLGQHDYRALEEVAAQFDCVYSFEVVEHLPWAEIGPWLVRLAELLRPGGRLLLSTPNTFYPPDFLRDATHRTPLCYDELGGVVELSGLHVTHIYRIYNDPLHRKLARRYLFGWLFRLLGLDFARQIVLVAEKRTA